MAERQFWGQKISQAQGLDKVPGGCWGPGGERKGGAGGLPVPYCHLTNSLLICILAFLIRCPVIKEFLSKNIFEKPWCWSFVTVNPKQGVPERARIREGKKDSAYVEYLLSARNCPGHFTYSLPF